MMAGHEERVVNETTGAEKGSKPERYDLIPWGFATDELARVYGFGAGKYALWNWRLGIVWSLHIASAFRHLAAFAAGEDTDPESGLSHLAHVEWHMQALLTATQEHPELDDRWKAPAE